MPDPATMPAHQTEVTGTPSRIETGLFDEQPLAALRFYIGTHKVEARLTEKDLRALQASIDRLIGGLERRRVSVN